jgi:predicted site-specific integrase-resolvase
VNESAVDLKSKKIRHLLYPPLNEFEAAKFLGVAVQTLRNWRHQVKGPPYLKLSPGPRGRVCYLYEDLKNYRDERRIVPKA